MFSAISLQRRRPGAVDHHGDLRPDGLLDADLLAHVGCAVVSTIALLLVPRPHASVEDVVDHRQQSLSR